MDCNLPGSSVHGILQAEILVWVAFLSAGDFPNPGIKPSSPALQEDSSLPKPLGKEYPFLDGRRGSPKKQRSNERWISQERIDDCMIGGKARE